LQIVEIEVRRVERNQYPLQQERVFDLAAHPIIGVSAAVQGTRSKNGQEIRTRRDLPQDDLRELSCFDRFDVIKSVDLVGVQALIDGLHEDSAGVTAIVNEYAVGRGGHILCTASRFWTIGERTHTL